MQVRVIISYYSNTYVLRTYKRSYDASLCICVGVYKYRLVRFLLCVCVCGCGICTITVHTVYGRVDVVSTNVWGEIKTVKQYTVRLQCNAYVL